jgi:hypothetical protein
VRDSVRHESMLIRFVLISNAVSTAKVMQIPVKARPNNKG